MQKGDIIFVRGSSPLSLLIKHFDKGEFSHVGIYLGDRHIIDSQYPLGVRIRHFSFKDYEVVRIPIDIERALEYVGYRYDFRQFLWYGLRVGKIWNTPNQFICSELVAHAIDRDDWIGLTPNELYHNIMEDYGGSVYETH